MIQLGDFLTKASHGNKNNVLRRTPGVAERLASARAPLRMTHFVLVHNPQPATLASACGAPFVCAVKPEWMVVAPARPLPRDPPWRHPWATRLRATMTHQRSLRQPDFLPLLGASTTSAA